MHFTNLKIVVVMWDTVDPTGFMKNIREFSFLPNLQNIIPSKITTYMVLLYKIFILHALVMCLETMFFHYKNPHFLFRPSDI